MSAKIFSYFFILLCIIHINALTRIPGNNQTRGENSDTFSFGIKQSYVTADQRMIVAAQEAGAQNFSLCALESGVAQFKPLAQETIIHNGQKDQKNPLFDAAIVHIAPLHNANIAVVSADDMTRVYSHNFGLAKNHLFSTNQLTDASGVNSTSGIVALAAGHGYAFAAVKGNGQEQFGTGDSGIALIKFSEISIEEELDAKALEKIKESGKNLTDAEKQEIQKAIFQDKDGKTKKRITNFGFAQVNTVPLNAEITDLYYSPALERLYIACKESGSNVCKIMVGHIDDQGKLQLFPIAMPHWCKFTTISQVKTLQTSTGYLDYLIVLAEEGKIYAFPLLNLKQVDGKIVPTDVLLHGSLAHNHSSLTEGYGPQNPKTGRSSFLGRHFNQAPLESGHLVESTDAAVLVGAKVFGHVTIDSINVQGDCVYAIINNAQDHDVNGVYQSHAIFAADGRIAAWTPWQKVYNSEHYIASFRVDGAHGGHLVSEGHDATMVRSVGRTSWTTDEQNALNQIITKEFSKESGGIQGLFDFQKGLVCVTGKAKVMLASLNPALTASDNIQIFNGQELQELGPIIAADISYLPNSWLWVGGVGGLAVVNRSCPSENFKKVGNFSFVKKIIADKHYLYVLTDTTLDRIDLKQSDFENNQLAVTHLAVADELLGKQNSYFYDCIVCGPLALLAHNKGLSRIANNHDVRVDDLQTMAWTNVPVTRDQQPCIALQGINLDAIAGQIYAICGSKRERIAKVYRLAVTQTESVSDATIMPLNDYVAKDMPSYYFDLHSYNAGFFTDGTRSFITHNKKDRTPAGIEIHYGTLKNTIPITIDNASTITHMVRCSATGKWIVAGDFGLMVNE